MQISAAGSRSLMRLRTNMKMIVPTPTPLSLDSGRQIDNYLMDVFNQTVRWIRGRRGFQLFDGDQTPAALAKPTMTEWGQS